MDAEQLRALARAGIEAATHAGADFADVRISDKRWYAVGSAVDQGDLRFTFGYGIRAYVRGHEAFVASADPTVDGIARAARQAATTAKQLVAMTGPVEPMIAAPTVTGEWRAPVRIDPFQVSPDDHVFVREGFSMAGRRPLCDSSCRFGWEDETRVFASSAGSLVTQTSTRFFPSVDHIAYNWRYPNTESVLKDRILVPCTAGFEILLGAEIHDRLQAVADEIDEFMHLPYGTADAGRREVVLNGHAVGTVIGRTIVPALMLERVLGEEQDVSGTSMLSPPSAFMGQPTFAPALHLSTDPTMPAWGAMQWDDEGVAATAALPLIENGMVVNYLGTRATRGALPVGITKNVSHGAAPLPGTGFAYDAMTSPGSRPGAIVVRAMPGGPSLGELSKTIKNGYLAMDGWVQADQQGAGGMLSPDILVEVRGGVLVRRIFKTRLEFDTKKILKNITAVGGASTLGTAMESYSGGIPFSMSPFTVTAPAVHIREVNVVPNLLG